MRFACESCLTRYTLADEKVKGRELKIRCKKCGAVMVVRDPALDATAAPAFVEEATRTVSTAEAMRLARETAPGKPAEKTNRALAPESNRAVAPGGPNTALARGEEAARGFEDDVPTRAISAAEVQRLVESAAVVEWFAMRNGEQLGPLSQRDLAERIAAGELGPRNYVWREGMDDWLRIEAVEELAAFVVPEASPPFPEQESTPQAPVEAQPSIFDAGTLFDEPPPAEPTPALQDGWSLERPAAAAPTVKAALPGPAPAEPVPAAAPKNVGVLRLLGAGMILAGLVAAGAYFFLPTGPAPVPAAPEVAEAQPGGLVRFADLVLPAGTPLDLAAVQSALRTRLPGYERCVADHALGGGRQLRIVVRAVIAPSGTVTAATVSGGKGGELGLCLADRTRDIRFPAFEGAPIELNLPFEIRAD